MNTAYLSLQGKVALVTGGSRGIGEAIALTLADAGANVVVASRKQTDLDVVASKIKAMGRKGGESLITIGMRRPSRFWWIQ